MKQVSSSFITNIFLKNNIQKQAALSFKGKQNPKIDNEESQKKYDEAMTSIGKAQVKIGKKKADEDYIVELARQGVSALKISEQTGHSKKYVSDILKKYDIKTPFMLRQEMLNSPEFIERVVARYKNGEIITEIAKNEGVPLGAVTQTLNKAGIKTLRQQIKEKTADEETRQKVVKLSETMSVRQIVEKTGLTIASVEKILEETNSKTPLKKSCEILSDEKVVKNIIDRFNNGETPQQIAEDIGVHEKSILRILNDKGIKTDIQFRRDFVNAEGSEEKVIELAQQGLNASEIKAQTNYPLSMISRVLKSQNIKTVNQQRLEKLSSEQTRQKIIDMAREGKNTIEIAKEVDAPLRLISGILQQENIPTELQEKLQARFDTETQKKVIEMAERGMTARKITQETGLPKTTVLNILKKANIKTDAQIAKERAKDPEFRKFIVSMYKRGANIADIERSTETSRATIRRILEAEGVKPIEIKKVSFETQKKVIELAKKGYSIAAIIEDLADSGEVIGYHDVNKILTSEGVKTDTQKTLDKLKSKTFQNEVIKKFKNGESVKEISEDLSVSDKAILNILNSNGYRTEYQNVHERANNPETIKFVIKRALEGSSGAQIADETGISESSVFSILTENNIQTKRQVHNENINKTEFKQEIIEKYKNGDSVPEIADSMNVSPDFVIITLNENGIKTEQQKRLGKE